MSEQIRDQLAAQAETLGLLIKSGQYADAMRAGHELQLQLMLAHSSKMDRVRTVLAELLSELK